jgi:hypothetical protein
MITGAFCHPEPCPELVSWIVSGSQVRRCSKNGRQGIPEPIKPHNNYYYKCDRIYSSSCQVGVGEALASRNQGPSIELIPNVREERDCR